MATLRYDGKVAVVTGAGNGLGKSYALFLASRGAKVVVNDLGGGVKGDGTSTKTADKVVDEIKSKGGEAVANYDSVVDGDKIIETAVKSYGRVDILINNAGILRDVSFHKMSDNDWKLIFDVHVLGAFKTTRAAWNHMRKQKYGRIVNVCSAAGLYGNFGQANYSAAKMALFGFTNTLAKEGASKNIVVNCIAPVAASRMTETIMPKDMLEMLGPEFVTPIVGYLVHESLEGVSGEVFEMGAGWLAKLRWERTNGAFLPVGDITPEGVKKVWEQAVDFTKDSDFPTEPNSSIMKIMSGAHIYKAKL